MSQVSAAQEIPQTIYHYAVLHRLGTPQIACIPRKTPLLYRLPGLISILVGGLLMGLFFFLYDSVFSWLPLWQQRLILLVSSGWLCVGIWLLLAPLLYPSGRVFICPDGLIYLRHKKDLLPWDLIMGFWKMIDIDQAGKITASYTVRRIDRKTFVFTEDLSNLALLGERLEDEVTRRLLPRAITTYKTGTSLYFGDIAVTPQGISAKRGHKLLPWDEVENVMLKEATLSIHSKGNFWDWETVSISEVPNVSVLKGVVDYILREHARNQHPHIVAFNQGHSLRFGSLSVSRQGILLNNGTIQLPWSEIAGIGVGEKEVIIKHKEREPAWYTVPLWMLSDVPTLRDLVEYIMRGKP